MWPETHKNTTCLIEEIIESICCTLNFQVRRENQIPHVILRSTMFYIPFCTHIKITASDFEATAFRIINWTGDANSIPTNRLALQRIVNCRHAILEIHCLNIYSNWMISGIENDAFLLFRAAPVWILRSAAQRSQPVAKLLYFIINS